MRKQGRKSFLEKVEIWRMEKVKATEKRTTLTDKLVRIWLGLAKTWLILPKALLLLISGTIGSRAGSRAAARRKGEGSRPLSSCAVPEAAASRGGSDPVARKGCQPGVSF